MATPISTSHLMRRGCEGVADMLWWERSGDAPLCAAYGYRQQMDRLARGRCGEWSIICVAALVDFFQLASWFDLLIQRGFERKPYWLGNLPISPRGGGSGYLPVMRLTRSAPVQGVGNYYTPLLGPVCAVDREWMAADLAGVAKAIRELPGSDVLVLQPFDPDDVFWRLLEQELAIGGYSTARFFCFGNWYEPVAGRLFADYWLNRPSRLRNTVERARRRLGQGHAWHTEVLTASGHALEDAIRAFQDVYARSWKQPEPCSQFMPSLIRMAAEQGALRLGQLWLDGEVVASQVWVVYGGKACIYKLAYVPGHEKLSLGSVLTADLMRHVIDFDQVVEVDYLMGDDAYKRDWVTYRRERVGLIACDRRRWRGALTWARHHAGRYVRRWLS